MEVDFTIEAGQPVRGADVANFSEAYGLSKEDLGYIIGLSPVNLDKILRRPHDAVEPSLALLLRYYAYHPEKVPAPLRATPMPLLRAAAPRLPADALSRYLGVGDRRSNPNSVTVGRLATHLLEAVQKGDYLEWEAWAKRALQSNPVRGGDVEAFAQSRDLSIADLTYLLGITRAQYQALLTKRGRKRPIGSKSLALLVKYYRAHPDRVPQLLRNPALAVVKAAAPHRVTLVEIGVMLGRNTLLGNTELSDTSGRLAAHLVEEFRNGMLREWEALVLDEAHARGIPALLRQYRWRPVNRSLGRNFTAGQRKPTRRAGAASRKKKVSRRKRG